MPEFDWRAVGADGRAASGRLDAASPAQVVLQLRQRGLVPVAVQAAGAEGSATSARPGGAAPTAAPRPSLGQRRGVTRADVLALTNELAIMLRAGLPLAYALRVLVDMNTRPALQALLQQVLDDVKGGAPLSRALARHGALFGEFHVQMVRAGEAAGQLPATLERLTEQLTRAAALREGVLSALTYPAILLAVALLSLVCMIGFVVPQFEKLFADMGEALPLATRAVLALSHHARDWGLAWLAALLAAGLGFSAWRRTPAGRLRWQQALLRLPLLGPLLHSLHLGLFARTLGTLAGSGVPLLAALDIAVDTVTSLPLRRALGGMLMPVKSGMRLAQAMADTRQFEALAVNLVRVGEETGRLGPMLLEYARVADQRVEAGIKRALALLEPLLIVVLGVVIAGIIASILLGILSVNEIAA